MNSSVQPPRRIASNLLWTGEGLLRDPLLELDADGRILRIAQCAEPDRLAATEFYAGVLVPGFPADYRAAFSRMCAHTPPFLPDLLRALPAGAAGGSHPAFSAGGNTPFSSVCAHTPPFSNCSEGVLVVISGLDYETMLLIGRSRIRCLTGR